VVLLLEDKRNRVNIAEDFSYGELVQDIVTYIKKINPVGNIASIIKEIAKFGLKMVDVK
jgi:hypothetical protein